MTNEQLERAESIRAELRKAEDCLRIVEQNKNLFKTLNVQLENSDAFRFPLSVNASETVKVLVLADVRATIERLESEFKEL